MEYYIKGRTKMPRNKFGIVRDNSTNTSVIVNRQTTTSSSADNIPEMIGCTDLFDGKSGAVPVPKGGETSYFLKADAVWTDIPAYDHISSYEGNLIVDAPIDFKEPVTAEDGITVDTLNAENVNAESAIIDTAHINTLDVVSAHFWELVVDKVKSTAGQLILSSANMNVNMVIDGPWYGADQVELNEFEEFCNANGFERFNTKRILTKCEDTDKSILYEWEIGDFALCETFNKAELGPSWDVNNKFWWTMVLETGYVTIDGVRYIFIDVIDEVILEDESTLPWGFPAEAYDNHKFDAFLEGNLDVEEGDDIVQLGHWDNPDRQNAILLAATNPMDISNTAPCIGEYVGINDFIGLNDFKYSVLSPNGNELRGRFLILNGNTYIDVEDAIDAGIINIETGLEAVGIHLDGENSTVKLIGSVEIHQNNADPIDTLTVWDEDENVRVRVSPESIPTIAELKAESEQIVEFDRTFNPATYTAHFQEPTSAHSVPWISVAWGMGGNYVGIGGFSSGDTITIRNVGFDFNTTGEYRALPGWIPIIFTQKTYSFNAKLYRISGSSYVQVYDFGTIISGQTLTATAPSDGNYALYIGSLATVVGESDPSRMGAPMENEAYLTTTRRVTFKVVQPVKSILRIGTDGIAINNGLSKYFYMGQDAIEMMWGQEGMRLDTDGVQYTYDNGSHWQHSPNKHVYQYTGTQSSTTAVGYQATCADDVIIALSGSGTSYQNITLPPPSEIYNGKEIMIYSNNNTRYHAYAGTIIIGGTATLNPTFVYYNTAWYVK